jgi:hypothetical protein
MVILAMALVLCGFAMSAQAATVNLTDANSTFQIETAPPGFGGLTGAVNWTVDGVDQLFQQQWFIGFGAGNQQPISNFPSVVTAPPPNNFANIVYTSAGNWTLDTTYALSGGAAGTGRSDLAQQATFNNISGATQNLRLYLYTDFDLSNTDFDNGVTIDGNHHAVQFDNRTLMDSIFGPDASRVEANLFANTFISLSGGAAYALNNVTSAGPGDVTWAFEWDVTVPAGGSFQLSLDNLITPVPVPPAVFLFGSGLLGLVGLRRFRKN